MPRTQALADQLGLDVDLRSLLKVDQKKYPGGSNPFSELGKEESFKIRFSVKRSTTAMNWEYG